MPSSPDVMSIRRAALKLGLLTTLYFSQGLPFGFFMQALPVLLRKQGWSLTQVGLGSLLAAPWALKFVWAPAVDRRFVSRWGRRKSWIVPLQLAAVFVLLLLSWLAELGSMGLLMVAVFLLNLIAATQDIATDALAIDLLEPSERGLANGVQVAGYRVGMIVGGGALLLLYDRLGAAWAFAMMAGLLALATLPVLFAREPSQSSYVPEKPPSLAGFLARPGARSMMIVVLAYKTGDAFATGMLRPFLADLGLGLSDVGYLLGTVGFVTGLIGALLGGAWVNRLGRRRALLGFGVLQGSALLGYVGISMWPQVDMAVLYAACAFEHLSGGMATVALFTCMMDFCAPQTGATDYTVQASAVVVVTALASTVSGMSAQALGYPAHFALSAALSGAALFLVARHYPRAVSAYDGLRG